MEPKRIIDGQMAHGLGSRIIDALAKYFKLEPEQITVENDGTSPEHTLVYLKQVKRSHPKIKLRLQELARHQHTEIHPQSEDEIADFTLRIEDTVIVEITEKLLGE